ncbi:MAG: DUF4446 family protein [Patescibacteria group bacterium]
MEFNQDVLLLIGFGVLLVWTVYITALLVRMRSHYNRLTRGVSSIGLTGVLEEILAKELALQKHAVALTVEGEKRNAAGQLHIQRIGIVRFNPFADTGGSQSFTLAVLDGRDNGIVITSLYARTGNRWYVKEIREGVGKDVALSKEETAAIAKAKQTRN